VGILNFFPTPVLNIHDKFLIILINSDAYRQHQRWNQQNNLSINKPGQLLSNASEWK
jgi:hypothetical protein